jgi:hypothetical protein
LASIVGSWDLIGGGSENFMRRNLGYVVSQYAALRLRLLIGLAFLQPKKQARQLIET